MSLETLQFSTQHSWIRSTLTQNVRKADRPSTTDSTACGPMSRVDVKSLAGSGSSSPFVKLRSRNIVLTASLDRCVYVDRILIWRIKDFVISRSKPNRSRRLSYQLLGDPILVAKLAAPLPGIWLTILHVPKFFINVNTRLLHMRSKYADDEGRSMIVYQKSC